MGLAKKWRFTKPQAIALKRQVELYFIGTNPFDQHLDLETREYWRCMSNSVDSRELKEMAVMIFDIIPHAAGVEGLFSQMSLTKGKHEGHMSVSSLCMRTQLKVQLKEKYKPKKPKSSGKVPYGQRRTKAQHNLS